MTGGNPRSVLSHFGGHSADCTSGIAILRCVLSLTPAAAQPFHLPRAGGQAHRKGWSGAT